MSGARAGRWVRGASLLAACGLLGCGEQPDGAPTAPAARASGAASAAGEPEGSDTKAASPPNLTLGPVSTFSQSCARCHGPRGRFYGDTFGELRGEALREIIEEMMIGPAGLQPTHADADAMAAYHRALLADEPFVVVTNAAEALAGEADALRGEADQGVEIAVSAGDDARTVERDGASWSAALPADGSARAGASLSITGTRGEVQTTLTLPPEAWSHGRDATPHGGAEPESNEGPRP